MILFFLSTSVIYYFCLPAWRSCLPSPNQLLTSSSVVFYCYCILQLCCLLYFLTLYCKFLSFFTWPSSRINNNVTTLKSLSWDCLSSLHFTSLHSSLGFYFVLLIWNIFLSVISIGLNFYRIVGYVFRTENDLCRDFMLSRSALIPGH